MDFLKAFITGGILCAIAQILIDKTKLTPARILVLYVTGGVVLTAVGIYKIIVEFGGAGATIPLSGFGYALAKGVEKSVAEHGLLGALYRRSVCYGRGNSGSNIFRVFNSFNFLNRVISLSLCIYN
jgi:stage V sporulation protein AE